MGAYIRLFADTDGGATSSYAVDYCRALVRIAPVRLVSVSGPLSPQWGVFQRLLETSMDGTMLANVVCTDPSKWIRRLSVPMPKENPLHGALASGEIAELAEDTEVASQVIELYTEGVRNVLLATVAPRAVQERATLERYQAVIAPSQALRSQIGVHTGFTIKTPVVDHAAFKNLVLGKTT